MSDILKNWRTTLAGVIGFLLSCPAFVSAFEAWAKHQNPDWREVVYGIAMFAVSVGLIHAKDAAVHQ
jgi:hypothetical protein